MFNGEPYEKVTAVWPVVDTWAVSVDGYPKPDQWFCAAITSDAQRAICDALNNAVASEKPAPIPDSIVQTYTAKIERDAATIKALRDKLVELCDRLNWKGPGRDSNIEITVREARAIVKGLDQIAAGVAFITDERLGGS